MSETITSKTEWLERVETGRRTWEEIVSQVDTSWMDRPGAAGWWTFKDVAAHLNAWRVLTLARLEAAAGDKQAPAFPWPDGMSEETDEGADEINQWFYARDVNLSAAAILAQTRDQFARLTTVITAMPEAELEARYDWLEEYPISAVIEGTLEHLNVDHLPEIREWIARQNAPRPAGTGEDRVR